MLLKRKLRGLDSLTTGSQKQSDELVTFKNKKGEEIKDFYNYIGLEVLNNWLLEVGETNMKCNDFFNVNADHIAKLPQNQKGYKGKKRSEETKTKQSLNSGKARRVYQYTYDLTYIAEYRSCSEAKRQLGINNIGDAALGKIYSAGGFKWRYDKL